VRATSRTAAGMPVRPKVDVAPCLRSVRLVRHMSQSNRRSSQTLIRFPAAPVNSLATVTEGKRLERFVRSRWGRPQGGIRALAVAAETSADTIYHWFNGQNPPDVYQLGKLAEALEVKRWQIVAAMDGETEIVPLDDRTRQAIREEVRAAAAEDRAQRGSPREQSGAA